MMMKLSAFFGLAAAAGLTAVAAASLPRAGLSLTRGDCASTVNQILSSTASQNASSAAVVGAIDNWLTGMCGVGFCSTDTLQGVEFATGTCTGITDVYGGISDNVTTALELYYPAVRDMMCLKNSAANNTFCMTQYLAQAGSTMSFNATDPIALIKQLISAASFNSGCNECTKAAAQIVSKIAPFNSSSITASCGADFAARPSASRSPPSTLSLGRRRTGLLP
ncbi:hypothetical protein C8R44DRAFT_51707 [Mycena epipterygia]|nr:hypothetical protein C8R44DRAFT_51707 [Mycena epipterygia]